MPARAQDVHGPLAVSDLGSDWMLADERWFVPPEGQVGPSTYMAAFQRDPRQGLTSAGPIAVTLGIDILPDAPPADATQQNLNAFLSFASPGGQANVSDQPPVGSNTQWYNFNVDLTNALPEGSEVPPGIAYGVVFQDGNSVVNMTTVGFANNLSQDDAAAIARTLATRLPDFRLVAAQP
jgi:hypothetical protein